MLGLLLCALLAADRPDEDEMFGGAPASEAATQPSSQPSSQPVVPLEPPRLPPDAFREGRVKEDFLKIGGRFYLRAYSAFSNEQKLTDASFNVPALIDAYLDARPIERLRAQILGRLQYDPFLSTGVGGVRVPAAQAPANPSIGLDQAWIAFDIARHVFITAGRQHVKWGTARIFNPTDFLSAQFRDPLALFDARLGVTMLKVSVPWEAKGWNFYAVALFEPTQRPVGGLGTGGSSGNTQITAVGNTPADGAKTFGDIGGAARVEVTFGNTQLALDGLVQRNRKARAGFDITTALGPIDLYAEVAVRAGTDVPTYRLPAEANRSLGDVAAWFLSAEPYRMKVAVGAAGGVSYDLALPNKRNMTFGGEYFYNSAGYGDVSAYPFLLFNRLFQPFYNGQHYAALTTGFIDNGARVTTLLSTIGNLSDLSFISRLDVLVTVLSFLQVEAFVGVHYGRRGGEFRFALSTPEMMIGDQVIPAVNLVAPLLDVGLGLRMSL